MQRRGLDFEGHGFRPLLLSLLFVALHLDLQVDVARDLERVRNSEALLDRRHLSIGDNRCEVEHPLRIVGGERVGDERMQRVEPTQHGLLLEDRVEVICHDSRRAPLAHDLVQDRRAAALVSLADVDLEALRVLLDGLGLELDRDSLLLLGGDDAPDPRDEEWAELQLAALVDLFVLFVFLVFFVEVFLEVLDTLLAVLEDLVLEIEHTVVLDLQDLFLVGRCLQRTEVDAVVRQDGVLGEDGLQVHLDRQCRLLVVRLRLENKQLDVRRVVDDGLLLGLGRQLELLAPARRDVALVGLDDQPRLDELALLAVVHEELEGHGVLALVGHCERALDRLVHLYHAEVDAVVAFRPFGLDVHHEALGHQRQVNLLRLEHLLVVLELHLEIHLDLLLFSGVEVNYQRLP
mmetsp:Transcript_13969/g.28243  ORF Transcript_13969/g.28243 Transcript_13969/m.28243 type:complete len:405 (-) Transcript_13969:2003-3217(-)